MSTYVTKAYPTLIIYLYGSGSAEKERASILFSWQYVHVPTDILQSFHGVCNIYACEGDLLLILSL